jgi:hypothetical protein
MSAEFAKTIEKTKKRRASVGTTGTRRVILKPGDALPKEAPAEALSNPAEGRTQAQGSVLLPPVEETNDAIREKEKQEYEISKTDKTYDDLYPTLDDAAFSAKIARRKEFRDTMFDGTVRNVQERADILCAAKYELLPHQLFVKNFLSFQTPYNSLLLYHGLGTGKTCGAIGVAEEMRNYMKQTNIKQRIIVAASPNVQANFKLQLFDERRLTQENGMWNIESCIGNTLIKEVNPTQLKGLTREKVISQISTLINQNYLFMGHIGLANYIAKKTMVPADSGYSEAERKKMEIRNIQKFFNNRLIIIDEVHNIRITGENTTKKRTAQSLMKIAKYSDNMRLLLLSATPLYNSYSEIIWLANLMNLNDKRGTISTDEIFDSNGEFKEAATADGESGRDLLRRKMTGYVSYIRGENPYTFPYRIYPADFAPEHSFTEEGGMPYPTVQLNKTPVLEPLKFIPVYLTDAGSYQEYVYQYIVEKLQTRKPLIATTADPNAKPELDSFGYTKLQLPLEALNMVYPNEAFDDYIERKRGSESVGTNIVPIGSSTVEEEEEEEEVEIPPPISMDQGKEEEGSEEGSEEEGSEEEGSEEEGSEEGSEEDSQKTKTAEIQTLTPESQKVELADLQKTKTAEIQTLTPESQKVELADLQKTKTAEIQTLTPESQKVELADLKKRVGGNAKDDELEEEDELDLKESAFADEENGFIGTLVGKRGMTTVMNFTDHSRKKPPEIFGFSYKPAVLEKYGRIFSPAVLPKYSSKISSICDTIMKSKGIVIVYTQYIEGGIVPFALALEELGFTRFGAASYTKSLFQKPPTEPIDSITMKPLARGEKGYGNFAKYAIITGDKSFSPNNAKDLKYITNPDNKNGEKIKVVLISKAASEGLDFKNIRQVHILDPWYNMNRIEQIIGRGVRNLSHCALPFPLRNVELYLHSTVLPKTPTDEAADLYVYRLAERKAVLIGKVTRLLKEIAVDCQLNIGQMNMTVAKLAEIAANEVTTLTLSTEEKQIEYRIGDKPFTDICDYMENCSFQCSPNIRVAANKTILDTYNNDFVKMNQEQISRRIRDLFKEQPFYKRRILVNGINVVKEYPLEQIYYVLTEFVRNKNEYLTDRYGRLGHLVNKGEIYAFQPTEIGDANSSILERTVPVEYKRQGLQMALPKEVKRLANVNVAASPVSAISMPAGPKKLKKAVQQEEPAGLPVDIDNSAIIQEMKRNLETIKMRQSLKSGEKNWYKHASLVVDELKELHGMSDDEIDRFIIQHNIDMMLFDEKFALVKYMYAKVRFESKKMSDEITESYVEGLAKDYLDKKIITANSKTGILLTRDNGYKIYIQSAANSTTWTEAESEEIRMFAESGALGKFIVNPASYPRMISFINLFKNREMVFKVKDTEQKWGNKGARVDDAGKGDIIKIVNFLVGNNAYTEENTTTILKIGLCVVLEMLARRKMEKKVDNKTWFLDPEQTVINKVTEYTKK